MKVLVTGSSGFIGSRVVRRLVEGGAQVRCLVRKTSRLDRLSGLPVERAVGDLADLHSLVQATQDCDAVVHLAAISGWGSLSAAELHEVIVGGTARLLQAFRQSGGKRFVYVSSAAAVDGTDAPKLLDEESAFSLDASDLAYAVAKHRAERLALSAEGFDVVVVNPAETYGPDDRDWITAGNIRDILQNWPAFALRGGTSLVHVDDVAAGIVAALESGRSGQRYILGGDNLTIVEIVRLVLELAGLRRPVVVVPLWLLRAAIAASAAVGLKPPMEPNLVGYACRYWFVNSSKARRELGYRPRAARAVLDPVVRWIMEQERSADKRRDVSRMTAAVE